MKNRYFICLFFLTIALPLQAQNVLNLYVWSGEIPDQTIRRFEKAFGIKVNITTYDNNEIMYSKLRASKNPGYDLVIPSSYFVDRMRRQHMLERLDKSKLPNLKNLNSKFTNPNYDPHISFSVPYLWGITGIFYNQTFLKNLNLTKWADLWQPHFKNQLMILDDTREVFSIALLSLGYSANDKDPIHIQKAFQHLKALMGNIKVFSSDMVVSIMIDEDATLGTAWNGDAFKASQENPNIKFVFPKEGFVIWVDNLAIPINAPHKDNAYLFINYILNNVEGEQIALLTHYPTTNLAAQNRLPKTIRQNSMVYPPASILSRGEFQLDLGEKTVALYEKYWEELKMSG